MKGNGLFYCVIFAVILSWSFASANPPLEYGETRTWTDREGRELRAVFKGFTEDSTGIRLLRVNDEKIFSVPFTKLSDSERHFLSTELEALTANLRVIQVLKNGIIASGSAFAGPKMPKEYTRTIREKGTGLDAHKTVVRTVTEIRMVAPRPSLSDRFFVFMNTSNLVDDGRISVRMWPDGIYTYTTVLGAKATIPKYTTTRPTQK